MPFPSEAQDSSAKYKAQNVQYLPLFQAADAFTCIPFVWISILSSPLIANVSRETSMRPALLQTAVQSRLQVKLSAGSFQPAAFPYATPSSIRYPHFLFAGLFHVKHSRQQMDS